jgi:hypothetical protein
MFLFHAFRIMFVDKQTNLSQGNLYHIAVSTFSGLVLYVRPLGTSFLDDRKSPQNGINALLMRFKETDRFFQTYSRMYNEYFI